MFYPAKLLWPVHLTPVYGAPTLELMLLATILCIGITIFAVRAARRGTSWWLFAWLSYLVAIVPTITGLSAGAQPWADRYSYLPAVSLTLPIGAVVRVLWKKHWHKRVLALGSITALSILAVALCVALSVRQLPVWRNGEALWQHAIAETPELPRPYANLGVVRESQGDHDAALDLYAKAVLLEPHYAVALYNMGVAFEAKGLPDSAAVYYVKAISADRFYDDAFVNLGNLYVRAGKFDDGIGMFERAIAVNGSDPDPYYNMGIAYYSKGDVEKALECFQNTLTHEPRYAKAFHNIGVIYLKFGANDPAMECFRKAARLGLPDAQQLLKSRGDSW
jgi:Tfp pilus assembly protein PilF